MEAREKLLDTPIYLLDFSNAIKQFASANELKSLRDLVNIGTPELERHSDFSSRMLMEYIQTLEAYQLTDLI